ncbi:NEDD4-binding protein 2 isoform X1 [Malaclemys terrapin pileata]|uniref:NEDD4-binding protein 2 isoform X1 n=2 Tax=Malaclemys terrapin pileata TaxID=2991368 RepID=UPI0023A87BE1|nr:NEDD4-binding protein 2 isoform X1 [Malaclemys terrapin pileata]XP_053886012.1 NEDD4-binding protein 2 isoform X1 [Malaclemys terrapin pileata]XP_053886013.1 NEDD4-binding protein 2 isoform X1 [Malaclemys terrapin pileata]
MPKKRKNLGVSPSRKIVDSERMAASGEGLVPPPADVSVSRAIYSVNKEELLNNMSEMFSDLDPSVVYMVLSECDFKVENAMDCLLELSTAAKGVASSKVSGFDSIASSLSLVNQQSSVANEIVGESCAKEDIVNFKEESEKIPSPDIQLTEELDSLIQTAFEKYNQRDKLYDSTNDNITGKQPMTLDQSNSNGINEFPESEKSSLGFNVLLSLQQAETENENLENFASMLISEGHKSSQPAVSKSSIQTKDSSSADMDIFTQVSVSSSLPELDTDNASEVIKPKNSEVACRNLDQSQNIVSDHGTLNFFQGPVEAGTTASGNSSSKCLEQQEGVCSGQKSISLPEAFESLEGSSFKSPQLADVQQGWNLHFSPPPQQSPQPPWNPMAPVFYPSSGSHSFVIPVAISPGQWRPVSDYRTHGKGMPFPPPVVSHVWDSNASPKVWGNQDGIQKMNLSQVHQPPVCPVMRKKTHLVGQVLVLLRGVPGSGKSFLARTLLEDNPSGIILSTDDYFYKNGQYQYDANCLGEAHEWNRKQAKEAFEKRISPIIIDNTNIQAWEMKPYVALSQQYKYKVMFREPDTWWKFKPKELERRNIHGVSKEKIKRMLDRYERCLTVNSILNSAVPDKSENADWNEDPCQGEGYGQKEVHAYVKEETLFASASKPPELAEEEKHASSTSSAVENNLADRYFRKEEEEIENNLREHVSENSIIQGSVDISLSDYEEKEVPLGKKAVKREEIHRITETETSKTNEVKSEETTHLHICSCEHIQEHSDKILEVQTEKDQYNEIAVEPVVTHERNIMKQNGSSLDVSVRPELLNFLGDWPVEQSIRQRTKRTRRIEKFSMKSDKEDKATSQHLLDSHKAQVDLADIQQEVLHGEKRQREENLVSDSFCVLGADKITPELQMMGDWPAMSSLQQRQHRSRRISKRSLSESDEAGNNKCDIHKNVLDTVDVLHGTSVSSEELQDTETSNFQEPERIASDNISEKKPQQNKRTRKHHKLALTFTNSSVALSKPEQLSTLNLLEEKSEKRICKQPSRYSQTEPQDFALLWRLEKKIIISENIISENTKVLHGRLEAFRPKDTDAASSSQEKIPYRVMYDKSTYVEESELISIDESENLNVLCKLFGSFSFDALKDLYERCNKDIVWATSLLLDSDEKCKGEDIECLQEAGTVPATTDLEFKENTNYGENLKNSEQTSQIIGTDGITQLSENNLSVCYAESETADILETDAKISDSLTRLPLSASVKLKNTKDIVPRTQAEDSGTDIIEQSVSDTQKINLKAMSLVNETEEKSVVSQLDVGLCLPVTLPNVFSTAPTILKPKLNKEVDNKLSETYLESSKVNNMILLLLQMDQAPLKNCASDEEELETYKETQGNDMISIGGDREESKPSNMDEDRTKILNPTSLSSGSMNINCLELALPPELALQLKEIFGPVGIDSGSLTIEDYVVHIDLNLAKVIHEKWKESIMKRQRKEDEYYKLLMQDLDDSNTILSQSTDSKLQRKKMACPSQSSTETRSENLATSEIFPFMDHWNAQTQRVSLREIMSEEIALQEKQDLKRVPSMARKDCAARLKEKQLFEMFPTINQNFLMDIFKDNNYSLEQTEQFLNCVLEADPVKTVVAQEIAQQSDTLPSCSAIKNREKKAKKSKEAEDVLNEMAFQDIEYPGYDDFRAEAFLHQQKKQECLKKAEEAYRMGMKPVATFYAQQGRLHEQKMKEANHDAAVQIFEKVNASLLPENVLDLHGLHVDEAINHLSRVLQEKSHEYKQTGGKPYLCVITGRGNHSQGGVARIKPAAIKYLTSHNFRFTEIKPGCLKVMLK